MKKLLVAAAALAFAVNVNAEENAGGYGTIGGVSTTTVAAGVVGVAVAAAIISNNRGSSVEIIEPPKEATCNAGDGAPVNGICTGVQVTGTGTMTSTTTYTYQATVK